MKAQVEVLEGTAIDYDWYRLDGQDKVTDIQISSIEIERRFEQLQDVEVFEVEGGRRHYRSTSKQLPALLAAMTDGFCNKIIHMVSHNGDYHIYMMVININDEDTIWQVQGWLN